LPQLPQVSLLFATTSRAIYGKMLQEVMLVR